jgi:hypothetical protein
MDLQTGMPCVGRRVWARNVLDPVPILDLIDFVLMCLDSRGQKIMDKVLQTQVVEKRRQAEASPATPVPRTK